MTLFHAFSPKLKSLQQAVVITEVGPVLVRCDAVRLSSPESTDSLYFPQQRETLVVQCVPL